MQNFTVEASPRSQVGKNANRRLRSSGKIPAVIYGRTTEAVALSVDPKDLLKILYSDTGQNTIFKLNFGTDSKDVMIRDFQLDPIRGELLHADFFALAMDEVMAFEVPVEVVGTAVGIAKGGILDHVHRSVEVECLPADVPGHIEIDVTQLDIGDLIRVEDLKVDTSKITILTEADEVLVTVVPPKAVTEAPEEAGEEISEPEVIGKGKAEAEEDED